MSFRFPSEEAKGEGRHRSREGGEAKAEGKEYLV